MKLYKVYVEQSKEKPIASLDGTTAWQVTQVRGTFAKES